MSMLGHRLVVGVLIGSLCTLWLDVSRDASIEQHRRNLKQVHENVKSVYAAVHHDRVTCGRTREILNEVIELIREARAAAQAEQDEARH